MKCSYKICWIIWLATCNFYFILKKLYLQVPQEDCYIIVVYWTTANAIIDDTLAPACSANPIYFEALRWLDAADLPNNPFEMYLLRMKRELCQLWPSGRAFCTSLPEKYTVESTQTYKYYA